MPTLTERIQTALRDASPVVQRAAAGGAGAGLGGLLGGLIGGKGGARVAALVGGTAGTIFGPQIAQILGGTTGIQEQIEKQVDVSFGIVPAVENLVGAERGIQARVVALARARGGAERGRILQREQARLRAQRVAPIGGSFLDFVGL